MTSDAENVAEELRRINKEREHWSYDASGAPCGYVCADCGADGCKLWREYQTFLSQQRLRCVKCAARAEKITITDIDDAGRRMRRGGHRTDQIGTLVPAVPCEDQPTYWGYASVPPRGVGWWQRLPTWPRDLPEVACAQGR